MRVELEIVVAGLKISCSPQELRELAAELVRAATERESHLVDQTASKAGKEEE